MPCRKTPQICRSTVAAQPLAPDTGIFLQKLPFPFSPALRLAYRRVSVMFSAVKEGVFQPTLGVEYTDDEVGFEAEEHWGGGTAREEVSKTKWER